MEERTHVDGMFRSDEELEQSLDRELRERCINIAWQMAVSGHADIGSFGTMIDTADALFNYIKTGAK